MKTIGVIGGMSWESTVSYYQVLNETIRDHLGGLHSGKILLYSVDFSQIEHYQASGQWEKSAEVLVDAARRLVAGGADFLIIATNTMHKVHSEIQASVNVPVLHIADLTANELEAASINTVGLLGTKYTMLEDFYKNRLVEHGFTVLIPEPVDVDLVNDVIYDQLCLGVINEDSRHEFQRIINQFAARGAQGVILGCTEIGLLIKPEHSQLPVFDTALIHARSAALASLEE